MAKDAKGHGSNPRGAHAAGVEQVGQVALTPSLAAMKMQMTGSATVPTSQSYPEGSWQRRDMEMLEASNHKDAVEYARLTGGSVGKINRALARGVWDSRSDAKLIRDGMKASSHAWTMAHWDEIKRARGMK
jgi:hypothetical protein